MWHSEIRTTTLASNYQCYQKYFIQPLGESLHYLPQSILGITRVRVHHHHHHHHQINIPILRKLPAPNLLALRKSTILDTRGKLPFVHDHIRHTCPTNPPLRHLRPLRNTHNIRHQHAITLFTRILPRNRRLLPPLLRAPTKLRCDQSTLPTPCRISYELAE